MVPKHEPVHAEAAIAAAKTPPTVTSPTFASVGTTTATDFPVTPNAFQDKRKGTRDGFVLRLSAAGDSLVFSTYLGGSSSDNAAGVDIGAGGEAYDCSDPSRVEILVDDSDVRHVYACSDEALFYAAGYQMAASTAWS